jgi:hypothetical protein
MQLSYEMNSFLDYPATNTFYQLVTPVTGNQ